MSKQVDVSDPSGLNDDDLRYAFDRGLISEEVLLANLSKKARAASIKQMVNADPDTMLDDDDTETVDADDSYDTDKDLEEWTVPQLKKYLDDSGVEYNKSLRKDELIKLVSEQ